MLNKDPIFICGIPRSGTSLMRAIIGSHPDVAIYQWDLPLWTYFYDKYANVDLSIVEHQVNIIDDILSHKKVRICDVELRRNIILKGLASEDQPTCSKAFKHVLMEYARQVGRPRWGLKGPRSEFKAQIIFEAFPDAKMVQMIRDPRDVAVSYRSCDGTQWGNWPYDPIDHIKLWKESVKISRKNGQLYHGSYITTRYEDLVNNPEFTVAEVCDFLQLDYSDDMLTMSGHQSWSGSNSFFDDIGFDSKQISKSAIERYEENLPASLTWLYQYLLKKDMKKFGYEIKQISFTPDVITIVRVSYSSKFNEYKSIYTKKLKRNAIQALIFFHLYPFVKRILSSHKGKISKPNQSR